MLKIHQKHKNLLESEDDLNKFLTKREWIILLDYDGTLAPIAETPDKAIMTDEMKKVLIGLSKRPQCHLAIISGRRLSELKQMVDIPNITYVGNHGFEIEGPSNLNFKGFITPQYKEALRNIKGSLMGKLSPFQGIWIEDKGMILTIHFRCASESAGRAARKVIMSEYRDQISHRHIDLMEGKKALEIRPPIKWDKGVAAYWIISQWQHQFGNDHIGILCLGDDVTDEDAFKMLDGLALTVKVGFLGKSSARYYLKNQQEVLILLNRILAIKN